MPTPPTILPPIHSFDFHSGSTLQLADWTGVTHEYSEHEQSLSTNTQAPAASQLARASPAPVASSAENPLFASALDRPISDLREATPALLALVDNTSRASPASLIMPPRAASVPLTIPSVPPPLPPVQPPQDQPPQPGEDAENGIFDFEDMEGEEDSDYSGHSSSSDDERPPPNPYPWHPLQEDQSVPCDDEMAYIESREEHSALDHAYWEQKTFFDLDDADLVPGASGRIDWLVKNFNGTKEKPNRQLVMRSPVVKIGGYSWQIKLYPMGNRTDFMSVYVECVTMQNPLFVGQRDFVEPPLPWIKGTTALKQRVSIAVQVAVVMYNPAEPRVHEHRSDAHQYHKQNPDFGWKYFTSDVRPAFHNRTHGQRRAILQDDCLAFSAYIRIVDDPTGCLWRAPQPNAETSIATTSLRPLDGTSAQTATMVLLMHIRPLRKWIEHTKQKSAYVSFLQMVVAKALARRLKVKHLRHNPILDGCDVIAVLKSICTAMKSDAGADAEAALAKLFTILTDEHQLIAHNRLDTDRATSIQQAVSKVQATIAPAILLVELKRQTFAREKRSWQKLTNNVNIDDHVTFCRQQYHLHGVIMHKGPLGSGVYVPIVRPGGPGKLWYMYDRELVTCLTDKAARSKFSGKDHISQSRKTDSPAAKQNKDDVVYLAWYSRDDYGSFPPTVELEEYCPLPELTPKPAHDLKKSPHHESKRWSVKETPLPDPTPTSALRSTLTTTFHNTVAASSNFMDGEDVIMSDTEEDFVQHTSLSRALHAAAKTTGLEMPQPCDDNKTTNVVFSYFSGDYYNGSVLAHGIYHGEGWLIRTNGDEYRGNFRHGQPHGQGTMVYSVNGDTYEGEWFEGQHHGHGKFVEKQTGNVYEGGWKEGRRHGAFVLRGTVTEDDKHYCQICYEKVIDTAFYACGHALACKQCAKAVSTCPVCRKEVHARLELFGVKVSMQ